MLEVVLLIKRAWSIFEVFAEDRELAYIQSCSLGSYYPITVQLSSPKLCVYKSKPGPLLRLCITMCA